MPSCLIIEQDGYWIEQIRSALASEGWPVLIVQDPKDIPAEPVSTDLVFVGTDLAEAEELLRRFSRRSSSSCCVGLAPPEPAPVEAAVKHEADGLLRKPFTEAQLWGTVRSLLSTRVVAGPSSGDKLTSKEIFGDMLAELTSDSETVEEAGTDPEMEAAFAADPRPTAKEPTAVTGTPPVVSAPKPATSPPTSPNVPHREPVEEPDGEPGKTSSTPSRAPQDRSTGDRAARGKDDAEIQKALEETLSGVLSPELLNPELLKPKSTPSGARLKQDAKDVDKLLSDTLSGLALEGRRRKKTKTQDPASSQRVNDEALFEDPFKEDPFKDLEASLLSGGLEETMPVSPAASGLPRLEVDEQEMDLPELELPEPELTEPEITEPELTEPEIQLAEIEDELSLLEESLTPPAEEAEPGLRLRPDDTPTIPGQKFGHYTLLERIAVGGMAEVWKARMDGVAGFQKTVAIKKILPHLTENEQFQRMFVDEARLAAELNHPNITHIYDLGVLQNDYYIAMEYVEGRNLRSILNLASRKGLPIPHDLALLVASRLASALDYAHRKRDSNDEELGLVHRDVSPQNVLISYEGDIKLCDFGIVKAVTKLSKTESGALKGKLQYMSPEQAWGREVDSRSDIFSTGALLFEMLTGLRLFSGESELSVLEAVRSGRTRRPRDFDPTIPDTVDDLVAQAVAQDPVDRFQQAGRMRDQIETIFEQLTLRPSNAELASYLRRLISAPDLDENLDTGPTGRIEKVARFALPAAVEDQLPEDAESEVPFVEAVSPVEELPPETARSRRGMVIGAALLLLLLALAAFFLFGRDEGSASPAGGASESSERATEAPPESVQEESPQEQSAQEPSSKDLIAQERERMQGELSAQVAAQEEELREAYEAKEKNLQSKLANLEKTNPTEEATAQEGGGGVVPPGPGVKPPVLVSIDKPQYSAGARLESDQKTTGKEVVLYLLVDQNGQVEQVRQAQGSSLDPGVNEAAIRAARAAVFKPATKDGRRVKMWTTLKIPLPA